MLGNDISNKQAPILAFNIDSLVIEKKEVARDYKFLPKMFRGEKITYELDNVFINLINYVWSYYPYSIYFVTFNEEKMDFYYELLDAYKVNYTTLELNSKETIRQSCTLQYTYYFDNDEEMLSYISMHNATTCDSLLNVIK